MPLSLLYTQVGEAFSADTQHIAYLYLWVERTCYTCVKGQVGFLLRKKLSQAKGRSHHAYARDKYAHTEFFFLKNTCAKSGIVLL